MTARYVTGILVENQRDYGMTHIGMTVEESCPSPVKTRLFDQNGNPIYRVQDRLPIGFHASMGMPRSSITPEVTINIPMPKGAAVPRKA